MRPSWFSTKLKSIRQDMDKSEFENAVRCSGMDVELLGMKLKEKRVMKCIGQITGTPTFIMWDDTGRAFVFNQPEDEECCISSYNMEFLPYERDPKFDLVLE